MKRILLLLFIIHCSLFISPIGAQPFVGGDISMLPKYEGAGVVYTVGMIPFAALRKKPVAHFIFHLIVLTASVLMWVGIYLYVF